MTALYFAILSHILSVLWISEKQRKNAFLDDIWAPLFKY